MTPEPTCPPRSSDFVTIVSGLPRSGTSMMMQALTAGGLPALTDGVRAADADNPRGYYEFEPVKRTRQDPSWLAQARGKVVKMVYRLLYDLPSTGYEYRVIVMHRDIQEVLASQKKMLRRLGKDDGGDDAQLAGLFEKQLSDFERWVAGQPAFCTLDVPYSDMIASPRLQCRRINDFLGGLLDVDAMAAAVDPGLYRNRA